MMVMIVPPPPRTIPQEICGIICQDPVLDRRDLRALCFISRGFRDEAERLLYVAARVRGARRIKSFCVSLAWRPHLALRVRKLMLFMPPQMDLEAEDLSRIMHALHLCVNLRDLYVLEDSDRAILGKAGDAVQRWILDGHEFKLKRFVNAYFQPQILVGFLRAQPTIEMLSMQCRGNAGISGVPLPMLKNLDCSAAVVQEFSSVLGIPRNFERLQFEFVQSTDVEELATLVALLQFKDTLKSLSITRREGQNGLDIAVLTACVAAQLPDIKYLRIIDYTTRRETYHVPFLPFPISLGKIETLIFRAPTLQNDCFPFTRDTNISTYVELRTEDGRRTAAERIMTALSTLTRVVLMDQEIHEYTRNLETGAIVDAILPVLDDHDWLKVN